MTRALVDERARLLAEQARLLLELATIERAIRDCEAEEYANDARYRYDVTSWGASRSW